MAQSQSQTQPTLREEATAALKRLQAKDPGLKRLLEKAHGYAVFPAVGKAAAVVGGAYGRGVVFERGKPAGYATIAQLTVGVQLGGDTFTELVVFETRQALERFKQGKTAFAANASAVLVKAGAAAANNFNRGVAVYAYSDGGMLLELAMGGQKFKFKPSGGGQEQQQQQKQAAGQSANSRQGRGGRQAEAEAEDSGEEQDEGEEGEQADQEGESNEEGAGGGLLRRAVGGVRDAASGVGNMARQHPVAATLVGAGFAAGVIYMVARRMRGAGSGADSEEEGSGEQGADENEGMEDEDQADRRGQSEDYDEEEGEESNRGDEGEEEEEDRFMRRGRARA